MSKEIKLGDSRVTDLTTSDLTMGGGVVKYSMTIEGFVSFESADEIINLIRSQRGAVCDLNFSDLGRDLRIKLNS